MLAIAARNLKSNCHCPLRKRIDHTGSNALAASLLPNGRKRLKNWVERRQWLDKVECVGASRLSWLLDGVRIPTCNITETNGYSLLLWAAMNTNFKCDELKPVEHDCTLCQML